MIDPEESEGNIGVFAFVVLFVAAVITILLSGILFSSGSGSTEIPLFGQDFVHEQEVISPEVKIVFFDQENAELIAAEIGNLLAVGWDIEGSGGTNEEGFIILVLQPDK